MYSDNKPPPIPHSMPHTHHRDGALTASRFAAHTENSTRTTPHQ